MPRTVEADRDITSGNKSGAGAGHVHRARGIGRASEYRVPPTVTFPPASILRVPSLPPLPIFNVPLKFRLGGTSTVPLISLACVVPAASIPAASTTASTWTEWNRVRQKRC